MLAETVFDHPELTGMGTTVSAIHAMCRTERTKDIGRKKASSPRIYSHKRYN